MTPRGPGPIAPANSPAEAGRLDSWKQIAAYLDKSERTVRRWQETEGLPVHKHQHQQRGSVWAYRQELDEWLAQRRVSPEPLVEEPPVPPRQIPWKPMAALVGLSVVAIAGWLYAHRPPKPLAAPVPFTSMLSIEYGATFSPDGQQAAFFWGAKGKSGIYVKSLQSDEAKPLVVGPLEEGFTYSPAWSPDGKTIAFLRRTPNQETWLCLISPAGGPERKLLRLATTFAAFWADHQHLSWGPDSQWLLAPIAASPKSQAIHRVSVNGGAERLTDAAGTSAFSPALSPDARSFVFLRRAGDSMTTYELMRQELIANSPPQVVYQGKGSSAGVAWLPNGQDLVFCTQNSQASGDRETWLYRLPARAGATLAPLGIKNCNTVAVSRADASGRAALLYGSVASETTTLWQASLNALDAAVEFAPSSRYDAFPSFSPDGRSLAFVSNRSGAHEVWLVGADGNGARRVTEHVQARGGPNWSPDGSRLAFGALLGAGPDSPPGLATVPIAGGSAQAISLGGQLAHEPVWSRDGKQIYYSSGLQIWRSTADGRNRLKLLDGSRYQALGESPDGRMLYYTKRAQHYLLCRLPLGGGPEEIVADGLWVGAATLNRQALYFVRGNDKSLYRLPFDGQAATGLGPERKLGLLLGEDKRPAIQFGMTGLTVSPDDTRIIWSVRREPQIDLALIRDIH